MELLLKDVVRLLNVPENTVYRWIDEKSFPACHINGQLRFNKVALFEWATSNGVALGSDFHEVLCGKGQSLPGMAEALHQGGIFYNIRGDDKPAILKAVVERLPLHPQMDRTFLLQVLLSREALGSTGIGEGIAIPHPRNPIVLNTDRPMLSLSFLEKPVSFDSPDHLPVHTLFLLISPAVRTHLHMLSRIAQVLQQERFKELLGEKAPADRLLEGLKDIEEELDSLK
jgi:nitrogen PTS system EIIA component